MRASARGAANSIMVYGGLGTDTDFTQTVYAPWSVHFINLQLLAVAASTRLGTLNDLASATVSIRNIILELQKRTENIDFPLCQAVLRMLPRCSSPQAGSRRRIHSSLSN